MRGNQAHTKVHYAGKDDDFIVFAISPQAVTDWRADKSLPLSQVVAGWQVFVTHK
jgi:ribosome maturation protein Sdo1